MACILVAEDEHLTRWSVAESLRLEFYQVDEASDGESAIELINSKHFDAVVSDYLMSRGRLTGLDVLKHFHQLNPDKPIVLVTGQDGAKKAEVESIGGVYLRKPIFLEDLLGIINRRLRIPRGF
jgi:DNA-binding NtrC family response regulator